MSNRSLKNPTEAVSKAKRMVYKNFDDDITRKHGIVIEGWPLSTFACPNDIRSQVELDLLLKSWQSGTTRFRKMSNSEHMAWVASRPNPLDSPPNNATGIQAAEPAASASQLHSQDDSLASPTNQPTFNVIDFGLPTPPQTASSQANGVVKKPRKTRSDKGKLRKKNTQIPGVVTFHSSTQ